MRCGDYSGRRRSDLQDLFADRCPLKLYSVLHRASVELGIQRRDFEVIRARSV